MKVKRLRIAILLVLLASILSLAACNQPDTPDEPVEVVEAATETPTPTMTPALPIATPTGNSPPPSPTATLLPATTRLTPSPTATVQTYIVKEGDTLLSIALDLDVSAAALAEANELVEEDFLRVGRGLIIPASTSEAAAAPEAQEEGGPGEDGAAKEAPASTGDAEGEEAPASPGGAEADSPEAAAPPPPARPAYSGPPLPDISHPPHINPLTGLPVDDPAVLDRRPLMVRIGNDPGARRSQVGLNQADVVYEEIAEWWVTRFSAIYLAETPAMIAPVRSARLINVQLAPQYQAALAHSGGSDPVRWEISQAPITDLDEYYNAAPYFYRSNQGWQTRLAIDAEAARRYLTSQGLEAAVSPQGFNFSETPPAGEPAPTIYIAYPRATSFTEWRYQAGSGHYLRWIGGAPLIDAGDGRQVAAANVIVYFAEHQATDIVEDANGATSIRPLINGVGPAWFFRDGLLVKGTWQTDGSRPPYFLQEDGTAYALKPGNTWIEVVPTYYTVGLNSPDEAGSR